MFATYTFISFVADFFGIINLFVQSMLIDVESNTSLMPCFKSIVQISFAPKMSNNGMCVLYVRTIGLETVCEGEIGINLKYGSNWGEFDLNSCT